MHSIQKELAMARRDSPQKGLFCSKISLFFIRLCNNKPTPAGPSQIFLDSNRGTLNVPYSKKIWDGPAGFPFLDFDQYCLY